MDAARDIEMSDDYMVLQQVMDEHGLSAKWLAQVTGRGLSTVYKYLSGEATIPSVVWRHVYARTTDQRILQLMTGDMVVAVVELPQATVALDVPTLAELIEIRKEEIAVEEELLNILEDGRVDLHDARKIEDYKRHHNKMMATCCAMYQRVMQEFERSRK
ncbi:MAG: hypothetical protein LLF76_00305 [Planctomycetaceae bacterium]|nr:hypothetical protein [Planctomycetaceae bacterium]